MKNEELFEAALRVIPGGVNSPVRAFRKVGGAPSFIEKAHGPYLWDAQGSRFIDFVLSWGPLILGHAHRAVVEAVREQAGLGMSYGAPTRLEVEMARLVCSAFASIEKVRFTSSGTEACMSAIRLARAATGRRVTVKFEGCYHGHADSLLVKAGSGGPHAGHPDSMGVPEAIASTTAVLPYNDLDAFSSFMRSQGSDVASVIVEPVAGNMGVVRRRRASSKPCAPDRPVRRPAHHRRGDHGVPLPVRREPGHRRRHAGHHLPGQDHRRRHAGGGLRRQSRPHGHAGARRTGLSGRNPLGQPRGHGRRDRHPEDAQGRGPI